MFCHLKSILVIVLLFVLGCSQEKSLEPRVIPPVDTTGTGNSGGTSEFTLSSSSGQCANFSIGGNYEAGKALGADARLDVTVNVTKVGDWTLLSNTQNGYMFIGAGTFTATGLQMITLQGVGSPVAAGLNTFTVKTCSVQIPVIPATSGGGDATDYHYTIAINGTTYQQFVVMNDDYVAGSSLSSSGSDANLTASIEYLIPGQSSVPKGKTTFSVSKGTLHDYYNISDATFKAFFGIGNYTVRKSFSDGDGVIISWLDAKGEEWSTEYGTGDESGSSFSIISLTDVPDTNGTYYLKAKMTFKSVKLYNKTTGAVQIITSGEMVSNFGHI
jgi:hypothetical protein